MTTRPTKKSQPDDQQPPWREATVRGVFLSGDHAHNRTDRTIPVVVLAQAEHARQKIETFTLRLTLRPGELRRIRHPQDLQVRVADVLPGSTTDAAIDAAFRKARH